MSQDPMDDERPSPSGLVNEVRQAQRGLLMIAVTLNAILLLGSIADVFPSNRLGIRNLTAMTIAIVISPLVNGMLLLGGLAGGATLRKKYPNQLRDFFFVAVWAPVVGALINFLFVLFTVPWGGGISLGPN